jgi:hypothetical protein
MKKLGLRRPNGPYNNEYNGYGLMPNTALEPTAAAPAFGDLRQIHACGYSRRGSALDR